MLQPHLEDGALLNRVAQAEAIALRTAERWVQRYRRHGLAGLARQPRTDRGARSVPAELMALIEGLALQTPVLTAAAIHRRLADVTSKHGWAMPSYGTVYAIVRGIEPALVCLAHDGPKVYRERFDVIYRREADGPNAIWQADHTQLDVWVRAERDHPAKPRLTAILDDHTRAAREFAGAGTINRMSRRTLVASALATAGAVGVAKIARASALRSVDTPVADQFTSWDQFAASWGSLAAFSSFIALEVSEKGTLLHAGANESMPLAIGSASALRARCIGPRG